MKFVTMTVGVLFSIATITTGCQTIPEKKTLSLRSPTGYSTELWRYDATPPKKEFALLYMHGKGATPESSHNMAFISNMAALGYDVYALVMPWSPRNDYQGTLQDGLASIDDSIKQIKNEKIVLAGHSMGGMAVLQYGSGPMNPKVKGLISIAPGHDPNTNRPLRDHTKDSAAKACAAMSRGEGNKRGMYSEMKSGQTYFISATAEYYCTHYSVDHYPNSLEISRKISVPILLISGKGDKLTHYYHHDDIFTSIPPSILSRHETLSGDHGGVLYEHHELVAKWIDAL